MRRALSQERCRPRLPFGRYLRQPAVAQGACLIDEWRREAANKLVPVIVSEASLRPARCVEAPAPQHPRQKRSNVAIELDHGRHVRVDSYIDKNGLGRMSIVCWVDDDPGSEWREDLAGDRSYRHAQGFPRFVNNGPGDAEARTNVRTSVRLPRSLN